LQFLARREYSRAELRGKLLPHIHVDTETGEAQPAELEALLDDFTARGWLSDARAATQFIHAKRQRFGTQRIVNELRQRGFSGELIDEVLPQLKESELEAAREVWQKKFGKLPQDSHEKARQIRFLQSRGFSADVILKLLRILETEETDH
jgi:regulatory protein